MNAPLLLMAALTGVSLAAAEPVLLTVKTSTVDVLGREAEVFTIEQPDGRRGLTVEEADGFHVIVKNELPVPTSIHWHGLVLPNSQDGVPFVTQDPIPPGGQKEYKFPLVQSGTYWMHSHYGLQEQVLTAAPLIIMNDAERAKADRDVTMMVQDFTFEEPSEILAGLVKPAVPMKMDMKMPGMEPKQQPVRVQVWDAEAKRFTSKVVEAPAPNIDVKFAALLANRRTADQAEVVEVQSGESVLLRMIAGSAATNFLIDTGALEAEALAVDGQAIEPIRGNFFQLGVAQRVDLRVRIPKEGGAFPVVGLGEGTRLQAGVVLKTPGADELTLAPEGSVMAGGLDNTQEVRLRAAHPLATAAVDRELPSKLGGNMATYIWTINGLAYPTRDVLTVKAGERVRVTISNDTMMAHPMHLHGHDFQIVEIDGAPLAGAMRDTVVVPAGGTTKIEFAADNVGVWAYHCHIIYHMARGMFTVVKYEGADTTFWQPEKSRIELQERLP